MKQEGQRARWVLWSSVLLLAIVLGIAQRLGRQTSGASVGLEPREPVADGTETDATDHGIAVNRLGADDSLRVTVVVEPADVAGAAQVLGRVLGANGAALAGVVVLSEGVKPVETRSDDFGRFELTGFPVGSVIVAFNAEGYASSVVHTYLRSEADSLDLGDIRLLPVGVVRLSIVDEAMHAIPGAQVALADGPRRLSGWGEDSDYASLGKSDSQGEFVLDRLQSGTSRVRVWADGFVRWGGTFEAGTGGEAVLQVIMIGALFIEGRVVFSDIEQAAGHIVRCKAAPGSQFEEPLEPAAVTSAVSADGTFRLGPFPRSLDAEEFEIEVACSGGYSEELEHSVVATPGDSGLVLALREGAFVQVHLSAEAAEVCGALESAQLELWYGGQYGYMGTVLASAKFGPEADLTFQIPTGLKRDIDYRLDLRFERDVGFYSGLFRPVAGETQDLGIMHPDPGELLRFTIVAEGSLQPIAGVEAELFPITATDAPFSNYVRMGRPAAGGDYRFATSHDKSSIDGVIELFVGTDGKSELLLHAEGLVPVLIPVEAGRASAPTITMSRGSTVCFQLLNGEEPFEHIALRPKRLPNSYPQQKLKQSRAALRERGPDPGGYVVYRGLPKGAYSFGVIRSASQEITVQVDGVESVFEVVRL